MHAVRWSRRYVKKQMSWDFTKWHITEDACWTICSVVIPLAIDGGTFLPETDDDLSKVTCKNCLREAHGGKI